MSMKLTSTNKTIVTVCLLSAVILSIIILVIIPAIQSIKKITTETSNLRLYMEQKYKESLRSKLTKKKLERITEDVKNYDKYLFKNTQALELIQLLENLSSKSKVTQKINNSNLDSITPGKKLNINLTVNGKYTDVLNYLHNLETIDYFVNIETIRLIPNGEGTTANLTIGIYVSK